MLTVTVHRIVAQSMTVGLQMYVFCFIFRPIASAPLFAPSTAAAVEIETSTPVTDAPQSGTSVSMDTTPALPDVSHIPQSLPAESPASPPISEQTSTTVGRRPTMSFVDDTLECETPENPPNDTSRASSSVLSDDMQLPHDAPVENLQARFQLSDMSRATSAAAARDMVSFEAELVAEMTRDEATNQRLLEQEEQPATRQSDAGAGPSSGASILDSTILPHS